ncbi:MAG: GIY-YIG nuclease family protein [Pelagibacteraceae bacterium]
MGRHKHLTPKQKSFAEALVFNSENKTASQIAEDVGYGSPNIRASELQNPDKYPLVVEYIKKLNAQKMDYTKEKFYFVLEKFNETFDHIQNAARRELSMRRTSYAASLMTQSRPVIQKFKQMVDQQNDPIKVYLAEENRPFTTGFYKIGRTTRDDVEDRRTFTDNPFGINYIAFVDYVPEQNFNLEKTLHQYFKKYSTKSLIEHGSTEWFQFKKKETILKAFVKASKIYLCQFECKHLIKIKGE